MLIVYVALTLILVSLSMFAVGKAWLTYYGFKDSPGLGIGVLLVPVVTLWFSFFRLEKEGKEIWVALWASGAVIATITTLTFLPTVQDVVSGKAFEPNYGSVQAATVAPTPTPTPTPAPEATPTPAPAAPADGAAPPAPADGAAPAAPADGAAPAAPADGAAPAAPAAPADGAAPAAPADGAAPAAPAPAAPAPAAPAAAPANP